MNIELLKKLMLGEASKYLCEEFGVQACLTVSTAAALALKDHGVNAVARTCQITFANQKWVDAYNERGVEWMKERVKDGTLGDDCWSVGIGYPEPDDQYPLHAVIHLPDTNEIIDLTAHQADRPNHNLRVEPLWMKLDELKMPVIHFRFVDQMADPAWKKLKRKDQLRIRKTVRRMIAPAFEGK